MREMARDMAIACMEIGMAGSPMFQMKMGMQTIKDNVGWPEHEFE
jgi:hypothetical protein